MKLQKKSWLVKLKRNWKYTQELFKGMIKGGEMSLTCLQITELLSNFIWYQFALNSNIKDFNHSKDSNAQNCYTSKQHWAI